MEHVTYTHPANAKGPRFIGGHMIMPGESRQVSAGDLFADDFKSGRAQRPASQPKPAAPEPVGEFTVLVSQPVKDITPLLPGMTAEQLDGLAAAETDHQGDKGPRKGLMDAIDEARLKLKTSERAGDGDTNSDDDNSTTDEPHPDGDSGSTE